LPETQDLVEVLPFITKSVDYVVSHPRFSGTACLHPISKDSQIKYLEALQYSPYLKTTNSTLYLTR
jgi:hypothetical protein